MSLNLPTIQRTSSPMSSGRSSPANPRMRSKEDASIKKDKVYRRYASAIERVLALFETSLEDWPDYISFLSRLQKVLQSKPANISDFPHKVNIAKRLAQCLSPSLPRGVHQKTLDVYSYIFSSLGKKGLSLDLPLYLPGINPVLSFGSLAVKPEVLSLFEEYVIQVDPAALRPALKSIILALLPALEEESTDEFERVQIILSKIRLQSQSNDTGPTNEQYFWQCFFLASITSPGRRAGALAYLSRHLPKLSTEVSLNSLLGDDPVQSSIDDETMRAALETVASPDPGLLVRSFCAGLQDPQPLVQRGFLDLLVTNIPLHSPIFATFVTHDDLIRLASAAVSVTSKRDMSLNRRLWVWFLGPELASTEGNDIQSPADEQAQNPGLSVPDYHIRYFEKFGLAPIVQSMTSMLYPGSLNATERARPLRIALSLMDRWEIGGLVMPQIFTPAIQSIWRFQQQASQDAMNEVLRSASMFFDSVESGLIWAEIYKVIVNAMRSARNITSGTQDQLSLVLFITTKFNIRDEEMITIHLPLASLTLLAKVLYLVKSIDSSPSLLVIEVLQLAFKVTSRLIDLIPERAFKARRPMSDDLSKADSGFSGQKMLEDALSKIDNFYIHNQGNPDAQGHPLPQSLLNQLLLQTIAKLVAETLSARSQTACTEPLLTALDTLLRKIDLHTAPQTTFDDLRRCFKAEDLPEETRKPQDQFPCLAAKASTLVIVCARCRTTDQAWMSEKELSNIIAEFVSSLWPYLSPSMPQYNVEAVRSIWRLQTASPKKHIVESTLTSLMTSSTSLMQNYQLGTESAHRFTTLWTHSAPSSLTPQGRRTSAITQKDSSINLDKPVDYDAFALGRPLLLVLDVLEDPQSEIFAIVRSWLQSLPGLQIILGYLVHCLQKISTVRMLLANDLRRLRQAPTTLSENLDDLGSCVYYLEKISRIMQHAPDTIWQSYFGKVSSAEGSKERIQCQTFVIDLCLRLMKARFNGGEGETHLLFRSTQTASSILQQFLLGPGSLAVLMPDLELTLIEELVWSVDHASPSFQVLQIETLSIALAARAQMTPVEQQIPNGDVRARSSAEPANGDPSEQEPPMTMPSPIPVATTSRLMQCLQSGLSNRNCWPVLDAWIGLLARCLPLYAENIFQILIPLVETISRTLKEIFEDIRSVFEKKDIQRPDMLEPSLALLLNALEQSLAAGHAKSIIGDTSSMPSKALEVQQGFFGTMVSNVFTSDPTRSRTQDANNRLTVLLCFKDAIRICFTIWSWGDVSKSLPVEDPSIAASFNYMTVRLRNRTRHIFEHLFAAEVLECLETLIEIWLGAVIETGSSIPKTIFNLLQVLDASRPKNTIPALFNALYSRTNPSALDPARKSTLTSNLIDSHLAAFLVAYTRSLEDDVMAEIWNDSMTFLRDVLANPMPHRQTLPRLLEFITLVGTKVDNTSFGEQRKLRKDLGDLFVRLLTATLTIRPMGFSYDTHVIEKASTSTEVKRPSTELAAILGPDELAPVLALIMPDLHKALYDSDRIGTVAAMICTQVIGPTFRSKAFPENLAPHTVDMIAALGKISEALKSWKKEIASIFDDPRFFSIPIVLVEHGWVTILRQWMLTEKDRIVELISRVPAPTSAGLMFGVGASSARLEADRKAQLNLRRIATLILVAPSDAFVAHMNTIQAKTIELLNATSTSSPSCTIRAEIYMLIRVIVLKFSPVHLSSIWPILNSELQDALSSAFPSTSNESQEPLNITSLLQACKLLDVLLTLDLDEFQLQEWLFITDTTDAVYPSDHPSIALVDELKDHLESTSRDGARTVDLSTTQTGKRRPLLNHNLTADLTDTQIKEAVLRPFFNQIGIHAFESNYRMEAVDADACISDLVADLFDDTTLV
ncbi:hypothetical protein MMC25_002667 [Agyrium rufum]|nr:hypothetical protein [Agyrium rufum]